MVKKSNRIKSQQRVRLYKAFEFAPTICCTDDRQVTVDQW